VYILFGGSSFEHEISIVSSITLKKVLGKIDLKFVFLDQGREFYLIDSQNMKSTFFSSGGYKKEPKLSMVKGGFTQKGIFGSKFLDVDTILNLCHGGDGENGVLSSLFEFYELKAISPKREASVISCNKLLTKEYAKELGVKVVDYSHYSLGDSAEVSNYPVIIKPARLGSSIGVNIVKSADELDYALDSAYEFDNEILIEPFIDGVREYNLAGTKVDGEFILSTIEEPKKEEFLDFEQKYLDFGRDGKVSAATISSELTHKLQDTFKTIYNHYFEGAIIRCDFFVIDDEVYLNEINPIPGSMANYLFDDFELVIKSLANSLPNQEKIKIDYKYINEIKQAKGKA
jgi:D-alanine-D-alanine ligase